MANNTIPIQIETLTPVHIGSGEELQGNFEYLHFQDEGVLGVIDANKILKIIGEDVESINKWVEVIDKQGNLLKDLPQLRNASSDEVAKRIITIFDKAPNVDKNTIKEQTHLGNHQPTIPGSSLKGAIRTAILTKLIKENPAFVADSKQLKDKRGRFNHANIITEYLANDKKEDRRTGKTVSRFSANKDVMRFLRVSDFYFDTNTTVVKNTVINLFNYGWGEKKQESAYWECIPQHAVTSGNIQIPQDLLKQVQKNNYITRNDFRLEIFEAKRLFKIINKHTLDLVDREVDFWEDNENPLAIGDYVTHLEHIKQAIGNCDEDACVIRVGASNGWEFMTGGWANGTDNIGDYILEDNTWTDLKRSLRRGNYPDSVTFPKTRKMIEGGMPLGFVKLSLV
jgi:CRISPR type III-A-associated RAMP protein Csm5